MPKSLFFACLILIASPAFAQYYGSSDNGQAAAIQHDQQMRMEYQMGEQRAAMAEQQRQIDVQQQQIDNQNRGGNNANPFGFNYVGR
jgi:Tfp pilus assembly protein PilE